MNQILRKEFAGAMLGVPGRFFNVIGETGAATLASQTFTTESRKLPGAPASWRIRAEIRFDDNCFNGHNSFAITASVEDTSQTRRHLREVMGGCCHDEIAKAFPELAPLIRWHLTSSDGPMHYIANTVYHAGDRDHSGRRKGEPSSFDRMITFGANPIKHKLPGKFIAFLEAARAHPGRAAFDFEVIGIDHADRKTYGTKWTFGGYGVKWHECPFDSEQRALDFLCALQTCEPRFHTVPTQWSEGKARDLDAARRCAIWPDAPDAGLSVEPAELKAALAKRHPHLMRAFREDMTAAGLIWTDSETTAKAEG